MARIVVADPDKFAAETIALCLERHGHEVVLVDNGAAAIDAIMQRRPQLLLTEIMLPMRSGYDVLDAVDGLGLGPDLLVLFVTAQSCEREMDRALIAGVSDYILKPFYPGELATRVKLALRRLACDQAQSAKPVRGSGLEVAA